MKVASKILFVLVAVLATADFAFAADGAAAGGMDGLAAGLAIGVAAFGGALAQGKTTAAALEGIGRNPGASGSMFVPMIIGLALIESLVIYALVVAFKLLG